MEPSNFSTRASHIRSVLMQRAAREAAASAEGVESDGGSDSSVHPHDVLARVDDALNRMPADEVGDPAEFRKAMQDLLQHGDAAMKKLLKDDAPDLSADELGSAEAIIVADGSRPSFLVRDNTYVENHPFLGGWAVEMKDFRASLRAIAPFVGRLQVPDGNAALYNGTGTLVPAVSDERLVLTNYHVVLHARDKSKVAMKETAPGRLDVQGDWVIDFMGETSNPRRNRWRVKEVRLPQGAGVSFGGLDTAVLRIQSFGDESKLLATPVVLSSDASYALGEGSASLVTIGFPGEPNTATPPGAAIDWNFVIKTLFGNSFGVKRVAPGRFKQRIGSIPQDSLGHVLSHDATTFGGASGSLVFAWREAKTPSFAVHFAGATAAANYAVSLHKAVLALRTTGVRID